MAKELPYFQFYINDWLTGNVTLQDMATQGVFINICVLFWSRDCELSYQNCIERFKKKDKKIVEKLLKSGIISLKSSDKLEENKNISIKFLEKQKENFQKLSKTNKNNVEKRYSTPVNIEKFSTTVEPLVYNIDKIRVDKSREDEIREDNIYLKEKKIEIEKSRGGVVIYNAEQFLTETVGSAWLEETAIYFKLSSETSENKLKVFAAEQTLTSGYGRVLAEIKKHFFNTTKKTIINGTGKQNNHNDKKSSRDELGALADRILASNNSKYGT